jgi:predicted phosphodiesterase
MRILILSDIHANATALHAALDAAKDRWDLVACLGDVVGYGPDPNEVTTIIRELGARTIRGNHDKAATDLMETDDFNPVAKAAVDWTRSQLSPENLKWISELPSGPLETDGIVLVHGAFQDEDEYVFTPAQALEGLLDSTANVTFFGHTHHQGGFSYENQKSQLEMLSIHPRPSESFAPLRIEPNRRYLLNPGSIGQPRDGDPRAGFAVADLENELVEFWRIPYDIGDVQSRMRAAKLPDPLIHRLVVGR